MASSDEEGEILPEHVTDYYFVDDKENLVSFAILPLLWTEGEVLDGPKTKVFMSGDADNGLQKVYKSVIAWKLELSFVKPVVLVLSKGRKWITLQKPRKSYENTIRTILITIHWLHLIKKNPELSRQFVWNHLRQAIRFYDTEPSENDLSQHMLLINQTVKMDEDLMKSKYVVTLLEKPSTGERSHEGIQKIVKTEFIVNEDEDDVVNSDGEEVVLNSIFDTVCSICDNGGTVLCCEGSCLRSFHPTEADGSDSLCQSLGFLNHVQVEALPSFLCKNCLYKQHQCYACGKLGSSDTSAGQEVFSCSSATCGHFYHPECVARLLHMGNENEALKLQETIAAGKSFTCPMHKCYVCKQSEDAAVHSLHLAICRRCPKAYHRKCLPKMITIEFTTDKSLLQRAWDGLLPENRILIYCMDHKIDQVLGTPSRDHLKFPDLEGKEKKDKLEVLSCKGKVTDSIQSMSSENFAANRPLMKKAKLFQKFGSDIEAFNENTDEKCSRHDLDVLKKPNIGETGKNYLEKNLSSDIERCFKTDKSKFLPTKGNVKLNMCSAIGTLGELSSRNRKIRNTVETLPMVKPLVALDMEKGITALMEHSTSSFNVEEFKKRRQIPATYACNPSKMMDKTITFGRVEASVRAVRAALEKLEAGGSIDDAKTICGPEVLKQIAMWKGKLQVFLAPFLHGMRYTSFGRHFTKLEKLKEIVDRLCWYVQNGDTIVDFSCGSNDFSCLMKEKLENMEKFCSFKNYDLFRPKNDFNFEQRDWMSINLNELPDGSQLIMGLNPPFGFKASLANMFINKALQFRPKLIVLIVPEETRQLDREAPYDLVWEDDRILSGKSFYLPGSVDVDDKQLEQWNLKSPPLYLWSRHDWTARHKAIAQEHNHIYNAQEEIHKKEKNDNEVRFNPLMEEHNDGHGDFFRDMQECLGLSSIFDGVPKVNNNFEPGEVRGVIPPSEHREGYFPGHSNSFWVNDDMTIWKTDSTCIDMEISTP